MRFFLLGILLPAACPTAAALETPQPAQTSGALFLEASSLPPNDPSPVKVLRKHYVQILEPLLDNLPGRFQHPGWKPEVKLNLFDDLKLDWTVNRIRVRPGGGWVLWGSLTGDPGGQVVMAYRHGVLQSDAWVTGKGKFEIRYLGNGIHRVSEMDPQPDCTFAGDEIPSNSLISGWTAPQGVPGNYPQAIQSGCPNSLPLKVSQMMVLYTALAQQLAGGQDGIETQIDLDWAGMNMAFYNSGVTAEMELVGTRAVTYIETGNVITDIGNLTNPAIFPQLSNWMVSTGAHYVSLFVGAAQTTSAGTIAGVGYVPGYASVVYIPYGNQAFPHELGHNFGCLHDRGTMGIPTGDGYNFGYKLNSAGTTYIDIMSYQPGNWIQFYSNPDVTFQGQPTGVDPTAPTAADNALEINQNFPNTAYSGSNQLPVVEVSSPLDGTFISAPIPLTLTATASDPNPGGTVAQVDFFVNDLFVGTSTAAPFSLGWTPPAAGTYYISATAIDGLGAMKVSCPIAVYVGVPTSTPTPTYTITLTPTFTPTFTATPSPTSTWTPLPTATIGSPTATPVLSGCCVDPSSEIFWTPANIFGGTYGAGGYSGDGGLATSAKLNEPSGIFIDSNWNTYFCDLDNYVVRKISGGVITTVAGNGIGGYSGDGGPATSAELLSPLYVTGDNIGNLYICDRAGNRVRKVNPAGIISTYSGNGTPGYTGDGGPATGAMLNNPQGIVLDATGNLYIADTGNNVLRKVDTAGVISTIAGSPIGTAGYSGDGASATLALLTAPVGISMDPTGNIYFSDGTQRIREINTGGVINTIAGSGTAGNSGDGGPAIAAKINNVSSIAFCGGYIYLADSGNWRIRAVNSSGIINLVMLGGGMDFLAIDPQGNLYASQQYGALCGLSCNYYGDVISKFPVNCNYTPTATITGTIPTSTNTPTRTLSPTVTNSPTPSLTSSSTATWTPTATPTVTSYIIVDNYPTLTWTVTPTPPCQLQLWPDPFNPKEAVDGKLKVGCLPSGTMVSFYTLSGELLAQVNEVDGVVKWAGTNRQGSPVSSGIYFYVIQNGNNLLGQGKFLIDR